MVSIEYRKSISEVLEILKHTKKADVDKISPKFLEFLNKNALTDYEPRLDHSKSIKEMRLNDKTIAILSIIASKYWLSSEDKENFENRLKENDEDIMMMLRNTLIGEIFWRKMLKEQPRRQKRTRKVREEKRINNN